MWSGGGGMGAWGRENTEEFSNHEASLEPSREKEGIETWYETKRKVPNTWIQSPL